MSQLPSRYEVVVMGLIREEFLLYSGFANWWTGLDVEEQNSIIEDAAVNLAKDLANMTISFERIAEDFEGSYADFIQQREAPIPYVPDADDVDFINAMKRGFEYDF